MITAKIGHEELVKTGSAERTIGRLAKQQVFHILAEKLDATVWRDAIYAIRGIGRNVEVSGGIKCEPIRYPGYPLGVHFRFAGTAV